MYFSISQKAEFYTLKGMSMLGWEKEEANVAFDKLFNWISPGQSMASGADSMTAMFKSSPTTCNMLLRPSVAIFKLLGNTKVAKVGHCSPAYCG